MRLTPEQGRVLGCLVEKQLTTPQAYPLTDNALLAACNQTTSRDPVVTYDLATVRMAVRSLREEGLLRTVHRTGERSDKHQHQLDASLGLSAAQVALLGLLFLRGPQTPAELRARADRMHTFGSADEVEGELEELAARDEPVAVRLERQPGRKESRWAQVLVEGAQEAAAAATVQAAVRTAAAVAVAGPVAPRPASEVALLREEVAALREDVAALRGELQELRELLGGG